MVDEMRKTGVKNRWETKKISDVCEVKYGFGLSERNRMNGSIPVYGSNGIVGYHNESRINGKGIVIGRKGTIGAVSFSDRPFWPIDTTYYIEENKGNYNLKFFYFLLHTLNLSSFDNASAVPGLSRDALYSVEVTLPPLPIQQKIASILSAYDDLIELNERRIKILEEMARLIYKEWFVKFRFPGYEKVRMVESELGMIPEGWKVRRLGEVIELAYGKGLKEENRIPGDFPVYGSSGIIGTHIEKFVDGPGIVVGRKGTVGSVIWSFSDFYPIDTVFYVQPKSGIKSMCFLFQALVSQEFKNIQGDAAVPGLNRHLAYLNKFLVPNTDIVEEFEGTVMPIFQSVEILEKANTTLRQTRDMLLPRLIEGKIDVLDLEIKVR